MTIFEVAYRIIMAKQYQLEDVVLQQKYAEFLNYYNNRSENLCKRAWRLTKVLRNLLFALCGTVTTLIGSMLGNGPIAQTLFWVGIGAALIFLGITGYHYLMAERLKRVQRHEVMIEKLEELKRSFSKLMGMHFLWDDSYDSVRERFMEMVQVHLDPNTVRDVWYRGPEEDVTLQDINSVGRPFNFHFEQPVAK